MKKVILLGSIALAGTLLISGCAKAETAEKKDPENTATTVHDHAGHDHGEHGHDHDEMVQSGDKELSVQKTCPVMGGEIKKDLYVDVDGKRVYVCCQGCIDPIKKNPEKYLKKLSELGEKPETL